MRPSALRPAVLLVVAGIAAAGPAAASERTPVTIGEVTLELPPLQGFRELPGLGEQLKGHWSGTLGGVDVRISFREFPLERFPFSEPTGVTDLVEENYARSPKGFAFTGKRLVAGPYGRAPYASIASGPLPALGDRAQAAGETVVLGGLLGDLAYAVEARVQGSLDPADRETLDRFFEEGIRSSVEPWDPDWTLDEIRARWERDVPLDAREMKKPIRTPHFIVLTNSSAGRLFGKKMEEAYRAVQKLFPFDEVEGQRLMPVFLFRTREQYIEFYMHIAKTSRAEAARSKGHAWRDYYATYYEAPNDPTHIHEATHQIFKNRLNLNGGGSWFQEGMAEYTSTSRNQREAFARRHAKDRKHIPFETFVKIPALINNPHLDGENAYLQAASVTEFLREHYQTEKFQEFVKTVGKIQRGNVPEIQAAIQKIYGVDLAGLEEEWVRFWARR